MGSSSSKTQTIGYAYSLGMHMVLCHGPIDRITQIFVDKRPAWNGDSSGGRITIFNPNLFGGTEREGGVFGAVDILMGEADQGRNDYLQARLGNNVPAFRGVVSAVLRQVYLGTSPYIKNWAFLATRVNTKTDGSQQWLPFYAPVNVESYGDGVYLFFGLDRSGSMSTNNRLDTAKLAMNQIFDVLEPVVQGGSNISIRFNAWGSSSITITRYNVDATALQEIRNFVNGITISGGTDFRVPVNSALSFFSKNTARKNVFFFITDGWPNAGTADEAAILAADMLDRNLGDYSNSRGTAVDMFGINIDLTDTTHTAKLDNTPQDGVPVIDGTNVSELVDVVVNALFPGDTADLNPAHIIRECLTDRVWGLGYQDADIDDDSFGQAAGTLWSEGIGLSLIWDRQKPIEEFIREILKHIDGSLRVDPTTGKFQLKLMRDDYAVGDITLLDPSNCESVEEYSRTSFGELVNSVTVKYWDLSTKTDGSITVYDTALTQAQGNVVSTEIQYPGVTNRKLAARLAERDLKSLSTPVVSCKVTTFVNQVSVGLGDVVKLTWPDFGITELVMRVTDINFSDDKSNVLKISLTQDTFSTPSFTEVAETEIIWEDPVEEALPLERRHVYELPYYVSVLNVGQTAADAELEADNNAAFLAVNASRVQGQSFDARIAVDSGAGVQEVADLNYSPSCTIVSDLERYETTFIYEGEVDLDEIEDVTWCMIGDEIIEVTNVDTDTNTITCNRGLLDTIPKKHLAGSIVMFSSENVASDGLLYLATDEIDVQILPITGRGKLEIVDAPIDTVIMEGRAYKPYRPGNFRVNGYLWPELEAALSYPVTLTWSHRNRLLETTPIFVHWDEADVTPEVGTEYHLVIDGYDDTGTFVSNIVDTTTALTTYELNGDLARYFTIVAKIESVRDGFTSFMQVEQSFNGFVSPPYDIQGTYKEPTAPTDLTYKQF